MKKISLLIIASLLLSGCSLLAKEETFVCKSTDGSYVVEETLKGKNDSLETSKIVTSFSTEDIENEGMTPEEFEATLEESKEIFKEFKSVTFDYEKTDTGYIQTASIDYKKENFEELAEYGFLDTADADYVSIEDSAKSNESNGMTCVAQ